MKARKIIFSTTTAWVAGVMGISGGLSVAHTKSMMEGFAHLGYPAYFANLLGVAKLLGVCVLLTPGLARVKEWAYAGFAITIIAPRILTCRRAMGSDRSNRSQRWRCRIGRVRPIDP